MLSFLSRNVKNSRKPQVNTDEPRPSQRSGVNTEKCNKGKRVK